MEAAKDAIEVIMRVPGLFIIDYWWQHYRNKLLPDSVEMGEIVHCVLTNLVLLQGFLLLLLPRRQLQTLYVYFVRGLIIISFFTASRFNIEAEVNLNIEDDHYFLRRQIAVLIFAGVLGGLIFYLQNVLCRSPLNNVLLVFSMCAIPVTVRLANMPLDTLPFLHNFWSAATGFNVFLYITYQILVILYCIKEACIDNWTEVEAYDFNTLNTMLWNKLFVPIHFALFWLIEFFVKLTGNMNHVENLPWGHEWYVIILATISSICATPITLVATSVSMSYLSYFILCSTWAYLQGFSEFFVNNPSHSGQTEGLAMFWASIVTGLIEKKMPARMAVMAVILFFVLPALLKSMLELAEPVLLALATTGSRSLWRHFRALSLCLMLLIFPVFPPYLTKVLSDVFKIYFHNNFWVSLISPIYIMTSVQALELLVVYSLFLYDSGRHEPWENLDDTVYYTRAITKVLEIFVAIFLLWNNLWNYIYGEWSWLSALNIFLHCYFNICLRLQTAWESFLLRRKAVEKTKYLPSASEEQLEHLDDVCSICFNTMKTACVTPCQHFFHRTCLRKWLYVKETCPLCNSVPSLPDS